MELKDKIKKFVTDFRDGAYQHDTKRDSGLPHDIPEVERLDNLPYGPDEKWHTLDVYLPKKHEAPFPVILRLPLPPVCWVYLLFSGSHVFHSPDLFPLFFFLIPSF